MAVAGTAKTASSNRIAALPWECTLMSSSLTAAAALRARRAASRLRHRRLFLEALELRACPAVFLVDITADEDDGNTAAGDLSLREAVILADISAGNDTIVLPAGTYALTIANPPTHDAGPAAGDLDIINGNIIFQGAGQGATIIDASAWASGSWRRTPAAAWACST